MKAPLTISILLAFIAAITDLKAQELKDNADYQRGINYTLIIHSKVYDLNSHIKSYSSEAYWREIIEKRNDAMPTLENLLLCAKESFDSAKLKISDNKLANTIDNILLLEQNVVNGLKGLNSSYSDAEQNKYHVTLLMDDSLWHVSDRELKKEFGWNLTTPNFKPGGKRLVFNSDYQRILSCFLVTRNEFNEYINQNTTPQLRSKILSCLNSLLKCATESSQRAKLAATDPKKAVQVQNQIVSLQKAIGIIKTFNFKSTELTEISPGTQYVVYPDELDQIIEHKLYRQVIAELTTSPYCNW